MLLLTTAATFAIGYEPKGGWKKDEAGGLLTDNDGNPIYIVADGSEKPLAPGYVNRVNTEAQQHRQRANDAEKKLDAFGDLDPAAARAAVAKMKDVDLDELVNKGEIDKVKSQLTDQFQRDLTERDSKLSAAEKRIEKLALDNAFNSSDFLKQRVALPEDVVRATFRDRFEYDAEKDRVVPKTNTGDPLLNKHGEIATVDEAFQNYIESRSDKDVWLKAPDASGSGSQGGGGGRGGSNRMKRADFDALTPGEQSSVGQKLAKGEIEIVD